MTHKSPKDYPLPVFKNGLVYEVDLSLHLNQLKICNQKTDLSKLTITLSRGRGFTREIPEIRRAACYGFILSQARLLFSLKPLAFIGFEEEDEKTIIIKHIEERDRTALKNPEVLLLSVVTEYTKAHSFEKLKVIRGEDCACYSRKEHYKFFRRYNQAAGKLGFTYDENEKKYVLELNRT